MTDDFRAAAESIKNADALFITAGAGMGADSGLPDFRGNEGFWKAYPVMAKLGLSFSEMANPRWFQSDPHLAWAFYGHRLQLYRKTEPHPGFATLLNWARNRSDNYFVFTSNVDGQFQKAGFAPDKIVECHGSIHHFQCLNNCSDEIWEADEEVAVDLVKFRAQDPLPQCRRCGGLARPNILMFDDYGWLHERTMGQENRLEHWLLENQPARIVVIELGAGTAIPTVRHTSESVAQRFRSLLIRINLREPQVPEHQFGFASGALAGIRELDVALKS